MWYAAGPSVTSLLGTNSKLQLRWQYSGRRIAGATWLTRICRGARGVTCARWWPEIARRNSRCLASRDPAVAWFVCRSSQIIAELTCVDDHTPHVPQ
jgi:hypothetical protein